MVAAAGAKLRVRLEQVDGNGILPLRAFERAYTTAASFRRQWQKIIAPHLLAAPGATPLANLPRGVRGAEPPALRAWPMASAALLAADRAALAELPIDHAVAPVATRGGAVAATRVLARFVARRLARYHDGRRDLVDDASSGLSPYLHFGHISAHAIVARVWRAAKWSPARVLGAKATGSREGWWGLPAGPEAFLDELITWRELGYGFCFHTRAFASYASLPAWARQTLDAHAADPRAHSTRARSSPRRARTIRCGTPRSASSCATAGSTTICACCGARRSSNGRASPRAALATMIELNNRYAIDGRDPNSYSGILWTLGRFDRPWGPAREVFGTVRYMSSEATRKKMDVRPYLEEYAA